MIGNSTGDSYFPPALGLSRPCYAGKQVLRPMRTYSRATCALHVKAFLHGLTSGDERGIQF